MHTQLHTPALYVTVACMPRMCVYVCACMCVCKCVCVYTGSNLFAWAVGASHAAFPPTPASLICDLTQPKPQPTWPPVEPPAASHAATPAHPPAACRPVVCWLQTLRGRTMQRSVHQASWPASPGGSGMCVQGERQEQGRWDNIGGGGEIMEVEGRIGAAGFNTRVGGGWLWRWGQGRGATIGRQF